MKKTNAPIQAEIALIGCFCDHCERRLDQLKSVWIWNEHFACSRDHAQRAQAETMRAFKQHEPEERDIDLL